MPAVLPPTASSAPLLYSLYLVLPAYLRCARGVILQHEGHCKFCSWARLGRWSRATRRRTGRVRPCRAQPSLQTADNASSRARESSPSSAASWVMAASSPKSGISSQDRSVSRVELRDGEGTAPLWWPRALAKLGCCSSSELLNLRKGLHTAKVLRSSRIDSCCNL